jgi:hypothetical protein
MNAYSIKAQKTVKTDKYIWDSWKPFRRNLAQIPPPFLFYFILNIMHPMEKTREIEESDPSMKQGHA